MNLKPWHYIAGAVALAALGGFFAMREPRGIRNKNPLNIEKGEPWNGLRPNQTDARFAQFTDPRYGYRAAARIIASYRRRGVKTLAEIIGTWAPATENNVGAYIKSVSEKSGIDPERVVTDTDLVPLFAAMTVHENGHNPYPADLIQEGVSWA